MNIEVNITETLNTMSNKALIQLQFQIANRLRTHRVDRVFADLAKKRQEGVTLSHHVQVYETLLIRELRAGRNIHIDEALDMLDALLDIVE